jgi:hypothetical protein
MAWTRHSVATDKPEDLALPPPDDVAIIHRAELNPHSTTTSTAELYPLYSGRTLAPSGLLHGNESPVTSITPNQTLFGLTAPFGHTLSFLRGQCSPGSLRPHCAMKRMLKSRMVLIIYSSGLDFHLSQ